MRTTVASASDASPRRASAAVDQQRLWRVEPEPDERHGRRLRDVFDGAAVRRVRKHGIDDDAVARAKSPCGICCQRAVDASVTCAQ